MAIKVGNSWVSEAAYAHANARLSQNKETDTLNVLSEKYPGEKFSSNTAPYKADGINNIAISPRILKQMQNSPDKALEYEALVYDCQQVNKTISSHFSNYGFKLKAHGFIIDGNGGLSSWSITEASGKTQKSTAMLDKNDKSGWLSPL